MKKPKVKLILSLLMLGFVALSLTACSDNPKPYNPNEKVGPQINYTITGIEAGAGVMETTNKAINAYGLNKENYQVEASSTAAMLSTLQKAIHYHEPIAIIAWRPHWMFEKYPIKFLKDPKHIFGRQQYIATVFHKGFNKQDPGAYKLIKQFHWTHHDIQWCMYQIDKKQRNPKLVTTEFIQQHPKQVKHLLRGVPEGHGQVVKLGLVNWDSELSSTNTVAHLLEMKHYRPQLYTMDPSPLWESVARGSLDCTLSGWMPNDAGVYWHKYKKHLIMPSHSLDGARFGIAVPKYEKNINTIEDLRTK